VCNDTHTDQDVQDGDGDRHEPENGGCYRHPSCFSGTVHSRGITTHKGRYLSPEEVCELVPGLTKATLAQRRYRGLAPKFLKPSPRLVLYRENDVIAWIEGSEQSGTVDGHSGPR